MKGIPHVYKRRDISFNLFGVIKMKKTVMAACVALLFISSLLLVDGMVVVKQGKKFMVLTGTIF